MTQNVVFGDEYGRPWQQGTILKVPTLFDHTGVVAYQRGQQVMLQNSKRFKGKVATTPAVFSEGRPYVVVSVPATPEDGMVIAQRAWTEVHAGGPWRWNDNCQDLTSRVTTGKNGSPTRSFFIVLGALIGVGLAMTAVRES